MYFSRKLELLEVTPLKQLRIQEQDVSINTKTTGNMGKTLLITPTVLVWSCLNYLIVSKNQKWC